MEEINLRTTVLRGENGAVHIIANGLINTLSNMTREYAYYVFEATLAHGANVDRALQILKETGAEVAEDAAYKEMILAPIEVMGVDRLVERGVVVRARIKTLPSRQALVGREFNRLVNARLAAEGIAFPPVSLATLTPIHEMERQLRRGAGGVQRYTVHGNTGAIGHLCDRAHGSERTESRAERHYRRQQLTHASRPQQA